MSTTSIAKQQKQFLLTAMIGLGVVLVCICCHRLHIATRPYESGEYADVKWAEGGQSMEVVVTVRDAEGRLVPDADVYVDNNSGGGGGTTNEKGVAVLKMGESDFSGLSINNVWVVSRPHAYRLGTPSVEDGLNCDVRIK